jgi:hypothetical protein
VVRDEDEVEQHVSAAGISAALGRRGAVLQLKQAHDELSVVVLHRGRERTVTCGRATSTTRRSWRRCSASTRGRWPTLLAEDGTAAEVVAALTRTLGVPEQVGQVLGGVPVAQVPGVHEPPRRIRDTVRATMRGEYDPPGSRRLDHRLNRWERERPAGLPRGQRSAGSRAGGDRRGAHRTRRRTADQAQDGARRLLPARRGRQPVERASASSVRTLPTPGRVGVR